MDKVKHIICIILTLAFQGCTDPNENSIEFYKSIKRIKLLNDDYYIKSVRIIVCVQNTDPIRLIDSNFVEFIQRGTRGGTDISLNKMGEYYSLNGTKEPTDILEGPCLKYIIKLERFEIRKRNKIPDTDLIEFDSRDIVNEINVFTSNRSDDQTSR